MTELEKEQVDMKLEVVLLGVSVRSVIKYS